MALSAGSTATKADYDALKAKVQTEVNRRQQINPISFSGITFNNNTSILASQQKNLADVVQLFTYTAPADAGQRSAVSPDSWRICHSPCNTSGGTF